MSTAGREIHRRAKELAPIKAVIEAKWDKDPSISLREALQIAVECLASRGITTSRSTRYWWYHRWLKERSKEPTRKPAPLPTRVLPTWDEIIKAIPDTAVLGALLIEGFMAKIQERDEKIKTLEEATAMVEELKRQVRAITEDRTKIFQDYNELLAKVKTGGHFTIDTIKRLIVPKQ